MLSTTSCEFGDLVLIPFPFTDQSTHKKRPAVVISSATYHRERRRDLIVLALTSQVRPTVLVEAQITQWQEAGLLKPSVLKPVIATIDRSLVLRKLGKLREPDLQALEGVLSTILGR